MARELDDALLHLRLNEPDLGLLVFRTEGDPRRCSPPTRCWRHTRPTGWSGKSACCLKRVFKRVDMTARSLITLIEAGTCFAGTLAELVFAADRAVMFAGRAAATIEVRPRCICRVELRRISDGQRSHTAGDTISRRAG